MKAAQQAQQKVSISFGSQSEVIWAAVDVAEDGEGDDKYAEMRSWILACSVMGRRLERHLLFSKRAYKTICRRGDFPMRAVPLDHQ